MADHTTPPTDAGQGRRTPKNVVICLDGTWNNAYMEKERDDGSRVVKPTNVLKASRAVTTHNAESGRLQVCNYDIGVGSLGKYPGLSNRIVGLVDEKLGGAFGAGFEANIEAALTFLVDNYDAGDALYLFGFSRGAAEARGLTRFLDWLGGVPTKRDAYFFPLYFRHYVVSSGQGSPGEVKTSSGRGPEEPLVPVEVLLLGVWDTVMALGSRFRPARGTAVVERSFHVGLQPARCVRNARQALAIDEKRYDFRPDVWQGSHPGQTLEQRWFPGVHSNVGGGYVEDGLANLAFRWMMREAAALGLALDRQYIKHYPGWPQARMYRSQTLVYKVLDAVRFRTGRGVRRLVGHPPEARLTLDRSVVHRINSRPGGEFEQLELYRPDNVFELLAAQPDLTAYLAGLGLEGEAAALPDDVTARIEKLRRREQS
jgi:uncharacterized protein (DUF2235 family)